MWPCVLQYTNKWQQEIAIILIGYAQGSTQEKDTQVQISVLKSADSELIFQEKAVLPWHFRGEGLVGDA